MIAMRAGRLGTQFGTGQGTDDTFTKIGEDFWNIVFMSCIQNLKFGRSSLASEQAS